MPPLGSHDPAGLTWFSLGRPGTHHDGKTPFTMTNVIRDLVDDVLPAPRPFTD